MALKQSKYILPAIGLFMALSTGASAQSWNSLGTEGFSPASTGGTSWQRIRINKNNVPYISFNDAGIGANGGGALMRFNGSTWQHIGAVGFTAGDAPHSNFTFGNGDTLYFSYANGTTLSTAAVMMYDGSSWSSLGTNLSQGAAQYTNLSYTSDGKLYLAMIDMGQNNGAMVVKRYIGGNNWQDVGTGPLSGTTSAGYPDMQLDRNGVLHVAYKDDNEAPGKLRVKKLAGSIWQDVGQPTIATTGTGAGAIMYTSLAFDTANAPYVAYTHTFMGPPRVSVEKFNGSSWTVVGPPQFSTGPTGMSLFSALAVHNSTPYVVFQNGEQGFKGTVKRYNAAGNNWVDLQDSVISTGGVAYTTITTDVNGNVYAAYADDAHNNKSTVKKLSLCQEPVINSILATDTPICNGAATLTISGNLNGATSWKWYTGSCGDTSAGTGSSIQVDPTVATTYFVKGEGGCIVQSNCQSITVNVKLLKPAVTQSGSTLTSSAANGNQWLRNGTAITGATNNTYTATLSGWYKTRVSINGCSRMSDSVFVQPTAINNVTTQSGISVYPTLFSNILHIELDADLSLSRNWKAVVWDYLGRPVSTQNIAQHKSQIDLSAVAPGIYLVKVYDADHKSATFRIVKQ